MLLRQTDLSLLYHHCLKLYLTGKKLYCKTISVSALYSQGVMFLTVQLIGFIQDIITIPVFLKMIIHHLQYIDVLFSNESLQLSSVHNLMNLEINVAFIIFFLIQSLNEAATVSSLHEYLKLDSRNSLLEYHQPMYLICIGCRIVCSIYNSFMLKIKAVQYEIWFY